MHLRQLNLSITSVVSHLTATPSTLSATTDDTNINAIIQVVTTVFIIIMAVVLITCALFFCFHPSFGNGCCGVDDGEEDDHQNGAGGADGRRRRPPGLSRAVIDTFPTYMYSDVRVHWSGNDELECAVCLNEFRDVEILRLLPTCCHVFHPDCIDTWLLSRPTCPVCRDDVGSVRNLTEHGDFWSILGISSIYDNHNSDVYVGQSQLPVVATPDTLITRLTCSHPKSHSTGHSPTWTAHETNRFTLRLPEEVRNRLARWPNGGVMGLVSSPRSWYRHPSNIVGWCTNNGIYVIRNNNYHRFNNRDNKILDCLGQPVASSNAHVSWSASPQSDGPVDYSTLVNAQR
ncbi:hypothetical protein V2J09_000809 [Rumex salicifolius]